MSSANRRQEGNAMTRRAVIRIGSTISVFILFGLIGGIFLNTLLTSAANPPVVAPISTPSIEPTPEPTTAPLPDPTLSEAPLPTPMPTPPPPPAPTPGAPGQQTAP